MNKDQVKGRVDEMAGKAQKNLGDATGSHEHEAKGMAREAKGKVQKNWGDAKDDAQKSTEHRTDTHTDTTHRKGGV
ncbi:CsbD family protein [Ramlibacter rhizophilus]|uniref:CsbD family protein n=1 Tax=Ramlibacter rhizophilus TaxID=1781167 RepID=A0A4Z0BKB2_9BURK|nr:CsbD family protein [Ramlibacter rhizophilus]TFY99752.1 CsbD family protein [Ramlibacter rhizophilus]